VEISKLAKNKPTPLHGTFSKGKTNDFPPTEQPINAGAKIQLGENYFEGKSHQR